MLIISTLKALNLFQHDFLVICWTFIIKFINFSKNTISNTFSSIGIIVYNTIRKNISYKMTIIHVIG